MDDECTVLLTSVHRWAEDTYQKWSKLASATLSEGDPISIFAIVGEAGPRMNGWIKQSDLDLLHEELERRAKEFEEEKQKQGTQ